MDAKLVELLIKLGEKVDELIQWKDECGDFITGIKGHVEKNVNDRIRNDTFQQFKEREKERLDKYRPKISKMMIKTGMMNEGDDFDELVFNDLIRAAGKEDYNYENWLKGLEEQYAPYLEIISDDPQAEQELKEEIGEVILDKADKVKADEVKADEGNDVVNGKEIIIEKDDEDDEDDDRKFGWNSDKEEDDEKFGWE